MQRSTQASHLLTEAAYPSTALAMAPAPGARALLFRWPLLLALTLLAPMPVVLAQTGTVVDVNLDGAWCPMNHCNKNDNSFIKLPPLLAVSTSQKIIDPRVSQEANKLLGCYSGATMAVCSYSSPNYPALVAYDYADGDVLWLSPMEDLQGNPTRAAGAVLMARVAVNGNQPQRVVYAANPRQFVAYFGANGARAWARSMRGITPAAPDGLGIPTSISINDDKELVLGTSGGWVVKLNAATGATIDAYQMNTNAVIDGVVYKGMLATINTAPIVGNVQYMNVQFVADQSTPLANPNFPPIYVVRLELTQPYNPGSERKIRPLVTPVLASDPTPDRVSIGVQSAGGSPPAWKTASGQILIYSDANSVVDGHVYPSISAVVDEGGVLKNLWRAVIMTPGDDVVAAPALDARSGTLLLSSKKGLYIFRKPYAMSGNLSPPMPIDSAALVTCRNTTGDSKVAPASPFAVTLDPASGEIVAYTNFRVTAVGETDTYSYLGAFALPVDGAVSVRPLWCRPLGLTDSGEEVPGQGTYGQPVLFQYDGEDGLKASGLIVNTVATGTYIFK